ncbi:alpha-D-ribose 1-methylphosphonate 5-triphosphate synthase subunit PhnG [Mesorhizobium tianshanense]|uniref:Alpha-D-ribose 1-methylphosphonate 5-triphosphate synthase subunit PhnG n=2 Tax=Mesorhizobium tianshanense TaxID=39844 RepID=A0A562MQR9_9HYPH|nr:alpha-D-ribose 1-methylphosphonate 5-triphosphate synthase subunit PhnG [Mesorhizobium tianshanense]
MMAFKTETDAEQRATSRRADWFGILSRSHAGELDALAADAADGVAFEWLRRPHVGLVMVRGRAGGTGQVFNLGEMTVARASVRLADGTVGHGYVQSRDKRQAELAAIVDALLLQEHRHDEIMAKVIEPLRQKEQTRRIEKSRKAASTKVEFFTMVRGENPA